MVLFEEHSPSSGNGDSDFADCNKIAVAGHDNNVSGAGRHTRYGDRAAAYRYGRFGPIRCGNPERRIRCTGWINRHIKRGGRRNNDACRGFIQRDACNRNGRRTTFFSQFWLAGIGDFRCAGNNLFLPG